MSQASPARLVAAAAMLLLVTTPLAAQHHKDKTTSEAERIASQPARDVGLAKTKVPPALARAAEAPYTSAGTSNCAQIASGIHALDGALGPDFGEASPVTGTKAGQIADVAGEAVVNSIIPFRGLVREVSGAGAAQRRLQAATYAGLARRGYLRGIARGRGCH